MDEVREINGKKWAFPVGGKGASKPRKQRKKNDGRWVKDGIELKEEGTWASLMERDAYLYLLLRTLIVESSEEEITLIFHHNSGLIKGLPQDAKEKICDLLLAHHKTVAWLFRNIFNDYDDDSAAVEEVVNLLPYEVVIVNGEDCWRFKPSGPCPGISNPGAELQRLKGAPVISRWTDGVVNLPEYKAGKAFIVPPEVLDALPNRTDLYSPEPYINEGETHGIIVGIRLRCHNEWFGVDGVK